jgi:hypothetical protein
MKKLLLTILTLIPAVCLAAWYPNAYDQTNTAAVDAHVLSLITNTVPTNIEVNFQMGQSYTNHYAPVITIENLAVSFAMGSSNNFAVTYGVVGDFTNLMTYGVPIYVTPFATAIWPFIPTFDVKTNQVYFFVDSSGVGVTAGFPYAAQIHYLIPGAGGGGGGGGSGTNGLNGVNGTNGLPGTNAINWHFSTNFSVTSVTNVDVTNSPYATAAGSATTATNLAGVSTVSISTNRPNSVTPEMYGAYGDCIELMDARIATGSSNLFSPSSPFVLTDTNKNAEIVLAGGSGGTNLSVKIVAFVNPSNVLVSAVAVSGVTNAQCYYGHDDSAAFITEVNLATNFSNGNVLIKLSSGKKYFIDGPWVNTTGGWSLLPLPISSNLFSNIQQMTITIEGDTEPSVITAGYQSGAPVLIFARSPTFSTNLDNGVTNCTAIGQAQGVPGYYYGFNYIKLVLKNLTVRTFDNPTISAIDGYRLGQMRLREKVTVDTGIDNFLRGSTQPTFNTYAIRFGAQSDNIDHGGDSLVTMGYNTGVSLGECTHIGDLCAVSCNSALELFSGHGNEIDYMYSFLCPTGVCPTPDISGGASIHIGMYDSESNNVASQPWQALVWDVADKGAGYIYGTINFGVGQFTYHPKLLNANNLYYHSFIDNKMTMPNLVVTKNFSVTGTFPANGAIQIPGSDVINGLVRWWRFDEPTNATIDVDFTDTGTSQSMTNTGFLKSGAINSGLIGSCLTFIPGTMYSYGNGYAFGTGDFTLSLWVNPVYIIDGTMFDSTPYSGSFANSFFIYFHGTILAPYLFQNGNSLSADIPCITNVWNHVVLTRSSGLCRFWINGVKGTNTVSNTWNDAGASAVVGAAGLPGASHNLWGSEDEVRMYSRALTDAEIGQLYNLGHGTVALLAQAPSINTSSLTLTNWPIYPHIGVAGAVTWTTNQ